MGKKTIEGLYLLADTSVLQGEALLQAVAAALTAGAKVVQYRDKSSDAQKRRGEAMALRALCAAHDACFLVNDDAPLALDVGADGVHIGRDDGGMARARAALGADRIVGVSCYNQPELARRAQSQGADYVAFGAFFPSDIKPHAVRADIALLRDPSLNVPVVAIGGINAENAAPLIANGASAIAVISAVLKADDPGRAARELVQLFEYRLEQHP
ncbi:MAG: thiamine phosphate synthase [Gammaproteobacteria bacterium]|nr:MAG: thiamine phosphate synthase [Gammaproteobacteria bacterium]